MQEILIIALVVGVGYYLIIYKNNQPLTNSQSTQTEPFINPTNSDNKDLEKTVDILLQNIRQFNHSLQ